MESTQRSGYGRTTAYSPIFAKNRPSKNFQLPALNISTNSLTQGTNIPAPRPDDPKPEVSSPVVDEVHPANPGDSHTPQTPLPMDSPNPLRSHPTSTHSLSRQYQIDGSKATTASGTGQAPYYNGTSGGISAHNQPSPMPGKRPATDSTAGSSAGPAMLHPKRQSTSDSMSPPPPAKRPMSVRKFLGLRALSAAFGRSSSDKARDGRESRADGAVYHQRNRSTDMLSLFTRRPESRQSQQPSLRKRRSSLMLLGRRGSNFFGLSVDEEPEEELEEEQVPTQPQRKESQDEYMEDAQPSTPPPTLPVVGSLRGSRGLHETHGGFLNGDEMFKNI